MLDYNEVKQFYAKKLIDDLEGRGRVESAAFHTVKWAYLRGVEDGGLTADRLLKAMEMAGIAMERVADEQPRPGVGMAPTLEDVLYALQVLHKILADTPQFVSLQ